MADEYQKLSRGELEQLAGEPLPERAAMSLIASGIAAPGSMIVQDGEHILLPPPPYVEGEDV